MTLHFVAATEREWECYCCYCSGHCNSGNYNGSLLWL